MEFLSHFRRTSERVDSPEDDYEDSMTGEVIDSGRSEDGRSVWYRLKMPDGTTRNTPYLRELLAYASRVKA